MTREPIDPLTTLKDASLYSSALLGTYQFGGEFFEDKVLSALQDLDATNIVVLADSQEYRDTEDIQRAGEWYYFDHVDCPKIHHPKFTVLLGRHRGLALVGSANLTTSGWQRNGELMSLIQFEEEESDTGAAAFFAQFREFVESLMRQDMLASQRTREATRDAFEDAPWIPELGEVAVDEELQLLHNLAEPILPQVLENVSQDSLRQIDAVSPFFTGGDEQVLKELWGAGPDELNINIQPDNVEGFQSECLSEGELKDANISVRAIEFTEDEGRYIHAKLLLFKQEEGVWALYGSPNITTPALLERGNSGNVELAVLRYEDDPEYFDYLLDSEEVSTTEIDPESVSYRRRGDDSERIDVDIDLCEAYIDDGTLVVQYDAPEAQEGTLHLRHSQGEKQLDINVEEVGEGEIRISTEEIIQFCQQATTVSLTLHTSTEELASDTRWVALPVLKSRPRRSEVTEIKETGGRTGLVELIDRLDSDEALFYILQDLDFDALIAGGSGSGGLRAGGPGPNGKDSTGGEGMKERPDIDLDDIFEKRLDTYYNKVQSKASPPNNSDFCEEQFHELLNLYIGMSKMTMWWAKQRRGEPKKLAHIRKSTESLVSFVRMMRRHEGEEISYEIEEDHSLIEHVSIIAYLVDRIQVQAGFRNGPNEKVYELFRRTSREAISTLSEGRKVTNPDAEDIEKCLEEYSALEELVGEPHQVQEFCQNL